MTCDGFAKAGGDFRNFGDMIFGEEPGEVIADFFEVFREAVFATDGAQDGEHHHQVKVFYGFHTVVGSDHGVFRAAEGFHFSAISSAEAKGLSSHGFSHFKSTEDIFRVSRTGDTDEDIGGRDMVLTEAVSKDFGIAFGLGDGEVIVGIARGFGRDAGAATPRRHLASVIERAAVAHEDEPAVCWERSDGGAEVLERSEGNEGGGEEEVIAARF